MTLLAQETGMLGGRLTAMLQSVRARFREEVASDLACVNRLAVHVEHYQGKMLRPTLVLAASLAANPADDSVSSRGPGGATTRGGGAVDEPTLVVATVVEMIHVATLVHDDVLDEAEVRRGGVTLNQLTGNEAAVMLGDYLISHAYHLCSSIARPAVSRAIAAATNTICEGELLQLSNRNRWDLDERTYDQIVRRKTASLCGLCCRLPAMLQSDPPEPPAVEGDPNANALQRGLYDYGEKLGMAFQIVDDLLDLTGDQVTVGKTLGRDLQKGKLTLPLIHYLHSADPGDRAAMASRLQAQTDPGLSADQSEAQLRWIHRAIRHSDAIDYARTRAAALVDRAKTAAIEAVPDSPAREVLLAMADRVLTREN